MLTANPNFIAAPYNSSLWSGAFFVEALGILQIYTELVSASDIVSWSCLSIHIRAEKYIILFHWLVVAIIIIKILWAMADFRTLIIIKYIKAMHGYFYINETKSTSKPIDNLFAVVLIVLPSLIMCCRVC